MNTVTPSADNEVRRINIHASATPDEIRAHAWSLFTLAADVEGRQEPTPEVTGDFEDPGGRRYLEAKLPIAGTTDFAYLDNAEGEWRSALIFPQDSLPTAAAKHVIEGNILAIVIAERFTARGI